MLTLQGESWSQIEPEATLSFEYMLLDPVTQSDDIPINIVELDCAILRS